MLLRLSTARFATRPLSTCSTLLRLVSTRMPLRAKILGQQQRRSMSIDPGTTSNLDDVLFHTNYGVRTIELNRPLTHNALTMSMAERILERLQEYEKSQLANVIVIKGAGEKSFCAGGDVRALAEQNYDSTGKANIEGMLRSAQYFKTEYTLDHLVATYTKPYVAFMDGHTMGGGVGLSIHAPFRIATERTTFAMPEAKIGFFTDVGGSFFLPRMDGQLGMYLALTSDFLGGVDTLYAGIATHYLHSSTLPDLEARLAELQFPDYATLEEKYEIVDSTIEEFNTGLPPTPPSLTSDKLTTIEECFSPHSLSDILGNLANRQETDPFVRDMYEKINSRCPLSIFVTHHMLRAGANWGITTTFQHEAVVAERFMHSLEFYIGVKNFFIDKNLDPPVWCTEPLQDLLASEDRIGRILGEYVAVREGSEERLPLNRGTDYERYPHWWIGLPSEREVREKVEASNNNPVTAMTREQLVQHFVDARRGKPGVREKVLGILARKTLLGEDGVLKWIGPGDRFT